MEIVEGRKIRSKGFSVMKRLCKGGRKVVLHLYMKAEC